MCPLCGFYFPGTQKKNYKTPARILVLIKNGYSQSQIARFLGISRQRVHQIVVECNFSSIYKDKREDIRINKEAKKYAKSLLQKVKKCKICRKRFFKGFREGGTMFCSGRCRRKHLVLENKKNLSYH